MLVLATTVTKHCKRVDEIIHPPTAQSKPLRARSRSPGRTRAQRKKKKRNKTFVGLDFSPSVAAATAIAADDDVTVEMGPPSHPWKTINDVRHRGAVAVEEKGDDCETTTVTRFRMAHEQTSSF